MAQKISPLRKKLNNIIETYGNTSQNGKTIKHETNLYLGYDHPLKKSLYGLIMVEEFEITLFGLKTKVYTITIYVTTPNSMNEPTLYGRFYDKELMDKKIVECVQQFFGTMYAFRKSGNVL